MICENCAEEYDPIATRWICPFCRWKAHCCEGEPMPGPTEIAIDLPKDIKLPTLYDAKNIASAELGIEEDEENKDDSGS